MVVIYIVFVSSYTMQELFSLFSFFSSQFFSHDMKFMSIIYHILYLL
jgi:hypothetical protein